MRCYTFLYMRKSSEEDDRQTLSLDAQDNECRAYASKHEIAISEVVREAHSARKPGRPLFQAMLQKVETLQSQGTSVRILCHKPDRLLRNFADYARLTDLIDAGLTCLFVTGSYENNAQGKMAFGLHVLFAKYYVDNLSEEVKKGLREKIARGEWPGPAPLGYRNANRRVEIDPETAPLVRRAFAYYASGEYSIERVARQLHGEGLRGRRREKQLSKSAMQDRVLRNPFYCGFLRYGGQLHPASHEPLISVTLFEQVQARLQGKSRPRRWRHTFRYSGLFHCAHCNGAVVGDMKKGRYVYYRCSHRRGPCLEGYIREEALQEALGQALGDTLALPTWAVEALQETAEHLAQEQEQADDQEPERLRQQVRDHERKLAELLDLRLAGHVTEAEYVAKREELLRHQAELRERVTMFELPQQDARASVNGFIENCNGAAQVLERGTDAEVREFLRTVGSNYRLGGRRVDFEPVEPFTLAAQVRNRPVWCSLADDVRTIAATMSQLTDNSNGSIIHDPHRPV